MVPLWAKGSRGLSMALISSASVMVHCASILSMASGLRPMSSTSTSPVNSWFSAKRKLSFSCWKVSVRRARMMLARTLYVLSSLIRPDGRSMLTTWAPDALIYFTSEAKPPASGLFSPEPNSPSTTSVASSRWGGSNSCVTSVIWWFLRSVSRLRISAQSADRLPVMLKR